MMLSFSIEFLYFFYFSSYCKLNYRFFIKKSEFEYSSPVTDLLNCIFYREVKFINNMEYKELRVYISHRLSPI